MASPFRFSFLLLGLCSGGSRVVATGFSGAPLLDGLAAKLIEDFPDQPMSGINQVLEDVVTQAAVIEQVASDDITCSRDYSVSCPEGWIDVGDGVSCQAADMYIGNCPSRVNYGSLTPAEKHNLAFKCGTVFPCIGAREIDYERDCPESWNLDPNGNCVAAASYQGPCVQLKTFRNFNALEKAAWSRACEVAWPARVGRREAIEVDNARLLGGLASNADCVIDYTGPCPDLWNNDKALCIAPVNYSGICGYFVAAAKFTALQKEAFAEACDAQWPCQHAIAR